MFLIYDKTTGSITQRVTCPEKEIRLYLGSNDAYIAAPEIHVDLTTRKIDVATKKVLPPDAVIVTEQSWLQVRGLRNHLLSWADNQITVLSRTDSHPKKTAAQKTQLVADLIVYQQALRDITLQKDPAAIVWPTPPVI